MDTALGLKVTERTPLLLRRAKRIPDVSPLATTSPEQLDLVATHFTVVTTSGNSPEMHDQQEDAHR